MTEGRKPTGRASATGKAAPDAVQRLTADHREVKKSKVDLDALGDSLAARKEELLPESTSKRGAGGITRRQERRLPAGQPAADVERWPGRWPLTPARRGG